MRNGHHTNRTETMANAIATKIAADITTNTNRYVAGEITRDEWDARQKALWDRADANDVRADVANLTTPR